MYNVRYFYCQYSIQYSIGGRFRESPPDPLFILIIKFDMSPSVVIVSKRRKWALYSPLPWSIVWLFCSNDFLFHCLLPLRLLWWWFLRSTTSTFTSEWTQWECVWMMYCTLCVCVCYRALQPVLNNFELIWELVITNEVYTCTPYKRAAGHLELHCSGHSCRQANITSQLFCPFIKKLSLVWKCTK